MLFLKTISSSNGQKVTEVYFQSSFPPLSKESPIILNSRHTVTESGSQKNPDKCGKITWKTPFFLTTGSKERKVEKTGRVLPSRTFKLMFLVIFSLSGVQSKQSEKAGVTFYSILLAPGPKMLNSCEIPNDSMRQKLPFVFQQEVWCVLQIPFHKHKQTGTYKNKESNKCVTGKLKQNFPTKVFIFDGVKF